MRKWMLALAIALIFTSLVTTSVVAGGFALGVSRESREVTVEGSMRVEQMLTQGYQLYNSWAENMGKSLIVAHGDEIWITLDSLAISPASFGPLAWSTEKLPREDGKFDTIRPASLDACNKYVVKVTAADYHIGGNSIYLYETIRRGREVTYRLLGLIPVRRVRNDTRFSTYLQFTVVECAIPIRDRDPVNMGAWLQEVGGGGISPVPDKVIAFMNDMQRQSQQEQIVVATAQVQPSAPATTPDSGTLKTFTMRIKASRPYILRIKDRLNQDNPRVRDYPSNESRPNTRTVTFTVSNSDVLTYMIVGRDSDFLSVPDTEIEEVLR